MSEESNTKKRVGWNKGTKLSKEGRLKLSLAHIGHKPTEETRKKMSENSSRYWLGKARSEETKKKLSFAHKGRKRAPLSEETKRKIGLANAVANRGKKHPPDCVHCLNLKGNIPWNKDKKCPNISKALTGKKASLETRKKLSESHLGKSTWNKDTKGLQKPWNKGKTGMQVSWNKGKKLPHLSGSNSSQWKGGITPENHKIRTSLEMKLWRKACMERDNFTCQKTGEMGGKLVVHHINNFADFPELRTSIENGITLSVEAHIAFHKKYGWKNNTREQLEEYLGHSL